MNNKEIEEKLSDQKAALYIRVSTHWQIDKDSLPVQREELINYAKYALGINKYEVFEDAGYSAKNMMRPAFQQMMARLRTGEFSHLCVWKIDRISRNLLDFAEMYNEIKKLGITFVSKNEQFDTSNAMGEAMLKIILVFAELERKMTSERVTAVMLSRAANGYWNGGKVPFGYDYDKESKTFSIREDEATIVKLIFDLYEEHQSLITVSRIINERGIRSRNGIPWNPSTVRWILVNPFVTGTYRYNYRDVSDDHTGKIHNHINKTEDWIMVEDHHVPIIEPERQQNVIQLLYEKRRSNKDSSKTYERLHDHIFAGLLFCGYCGSQMVATLDKERRGGYRPSIYICTRKRRFKDCENKYVSDIVVGPFVLNYIANILKAQNNFGKSTPIETFERKLLRGEIFKDVEHIESVGLREMYDMIRRGEFSDSIYAPEKREAEVSESERQKDLLLSEKRKKERAIARLQSLYLYNDDEISQSDYIITKKTLEDDLNTIDAELEKLEKSSSFISLSDDDFMAKASMFIVTNQLQGRRSINYVSLLKSVDKKLLKSFVNSIIQKIVIQNGKITEIQFRNGINHQFLYKAD